MKDTSTTLIACSVIGIIVFIYLFIAVSDGKSVQSGIVPRETNPAEDYRAFERRVAPVLADY